jgi:hypothetical protein
MLTSEALQKIDAIFSKRIKEDLKPIREDIAHIHKDIKTVINCEVAFEQYRLGCYRSH